MPRTTQAQRDALDTERERAMLTTPSRWPLWPVLPVKRTSPSFHGSVLDVGFLYADNASAEDGFLVYCCDMYSWGERTPAEREKISRINYPTVEAMQADGWRVD